MSEQTYAESLREIVASRLSKFGSDAFAPRMVGLSMFNAWIFIVMLNIVLLLPNGAQASRLGGMLDNGSIFALVLVLLCGALAEHTLEQLRKNSLGIWAPAILCVVGTLCVPLGGTDGNAPLAFLVAAAAATGAGSGLFNLYWGRVYASIGGPTTAAEISLAYLLAALPVPLMAFLPLPVTLLVACVLPIVSTILLLPELRRLDEAEQIRQAPPRARKWRLEILGLNRQTVMVKLVLSSLVFGVIVTLVRFMAGPEQAIYLGSFGSASLVAASLVGAGVTLFVLFFSKRFDMAFTYRPVLILMTLGCLAVPFLDEQVAIAHFLALSGYETFKIMNWVILADLSYRFEIPSYRMFGFGLAAVHLGVLAGSLLGTQLSDFFVSTPNASMASACAMVFAMIIVYTFTLTERDVAKMTRERGRHPYPNPADDADGSDANVTADTNHAEKTSTHELSFDEKVELLAEQHDVTGRNFEVMQLLAHGRTAARIEQELYMSRGTVNTHMRRLYQKLDIHSRQELLDKIYAIDDESDIKS